MLSQMNVSLRHFSVLDWADCNLAGRESRASNPHASPLLLHCFLNGYISHFCTCPKDTLLQLPPLCARIIIDTAFRSPNILFSSPMVTAEMPIITRNRDYWRQALSELDTNKKDRISREWHEKDKLTSWPDILAEVCRREQDGCRTKERKLRFAGQEINLRNMMDTWVRFLDRIKHIGDIAVNADPIHAGLPWAAVRFLLTVSFVSPFLTRVNVANIAL